MIKSIAKEPIGRSRKKANGKRIIVGEVGAVSVPTMRRRKRITVGAVSVPTMPTMRRRNRYTTVKVIQSMNLDEMLEASKVAEMGLKGEVIPTIKSPKVSQYIREILKLNRKASTRIQAKELQEILNINIVEKNKKTINSSEAEHLYNELMKGN